jgi:hypothetical protein
LESAVLKTVFEEFLSQFFPGELCGKEFWIEASDFERRIFCDWIEDRWTDFACFFEPINQLLCKNIVDPKDQGFKRTSLEVFLSFVQPKFSSFSDLEKDLLFKTLMEISEAILELSIENGKLFLNIVGKLQEQAPTEHRFLRVLELADEICGKGEQKTVIWAAVRVWMLKSLLMFGSSMSEEISGCHRKTLTSFLSSPFVSERGVESPESVAWNEAVVLSLEMLNGMDDALFVKCFGEAKREILELINAGSDVLRKQISDAVRRRLKPE